MTGPETPEQRTDRIGHRIGMGIGIVLGVAAGLIALGGLVLLGVVIVKAIA